VEEHRCVLRESWKDLQSWVGNGRRCRKRRADEDTSHNNSEPFFRGRKLILNYTDGSPCPSPSSGHDSEDLIPRKIIDDDDDDDKGDKKGERKKPTNSGVVRRKNTVISLLCNSDPLAAEMSISFVHSPDECTYMFEARTPAACGGVEVAQQQLGPSGVFGVIALIAVLVYVVGGCVYQRTVMHQRGWRQLPNYSLWAGIGGFFYVCILFYCRVGLSINQ